MGKSCKFSRCWLFDSVVETVYWMSCWMSWDGVGVLHKSKTQSWSGLVCISRQPEGACVR